MVVRVRIKRLFRVGFRLGNCKDVVISGLVLAAMLLLFQCLCLSWNQKEFCLVRKSIPLAAFQGISGGCIYC